jgi:radical SAM protein with 4Fe4S-binding SPASM domain
VRLDPNIKRKSAIIDEHLTVQHDISGVPTFSVIEFNISELCNRTCEFCPRANPAVYPNRKLYMSRELMAKIAADLGSINYSGKALFSAFSEPLLHKDLEAFIALLREHCPRCRIEVVTNGDHVSVERVRSLFDSGLTTLLVSMYDGPDQVEPLTAIRRQAGLSEEQFILRVRYLPREEDFGLTMSNRAGMVNAEALGNTELEFPLEKQCFYPHYQMTVDFDGSVLLCPHDWSKRIKAGNLARESVTDVWDSKALTFVRQKLGCASRDFAPCNRCDVAGDLMGKNHFAAWTGYYSQKDETTTG